MPCRLPQKTTGRMPASAGSRISEHQRQRRRNNLPMHRQRHPHPVPHGRLLQEMEIMIIAVNYENCIVYPNDPFFVQLEAEMCIDTLRKHGFEIHVYTDKIGREATNARIFCIEHNINYNRFLTGTTEPKADIILERITKTENWYTLFTKALGSKT